MIYFVMFSLVPVIFVIAIVLGIMSAVTRNMSVDSRRIARVLTSAALAIGTVIYFYLVALIIDAQFDSKDLFSPSEKAKLEEWGEACGRAIGPGQPIAAVVTFLDGVGVVLPENLGGTDHQYQETRKSARYFDYGDRATITVRDENVRNHDLMGDLDAETSIVLVDGVVENCTVRINRHGR